MTGALLILNVVIVIELNGINRGLTDIKFCYNYRVEWNQELDFGSGGHYCTSLSFQQPYTVISGVGKDILFYY